MKKTLKIISLILLMAIGVAALVFSFICFPFALWGLAGDESSGGTIVILLIDLLAFALGCLCIVLFIVILCKSRKKRNKNVEISNETKEEKTNEVKVETPKTKANFCKFCGNKVSKNSIYCDKCGKKL